MARKFAMVVVLALGLVIGCAPTRASVPRLVASWPSSGAPLPVAPLTFELTFNDALNVEGSWAALQRDIDGAAVDGQSVVQYESAHILRLHVADLAPGEFRLHWHAVSARSGSAAEGEQLLEFQGESARPPRVDVSRSALDSGETLELRGSGFGKKTTVHITMGDERQDVKAIQTDARGGFQEDMRVPRGVASGTQPISATDDNGSEAQTAVQVRWGGWPPLLGFTTGSPGPASGEVTFLVSVRNRSDYLLEKVRLVLPDPDGVSYVASEPEASRRNGVLTWDLGQVDRGVVGPFRATYRASGPVAVHARVEFRHRKPARCAGEDCLTAFVSDTVSDSTLVSPSD